MKNQFAINIIAILAVSCSTAGGKLQLAHNSVSENKLRKDVEYLSGDECQGRLPFTPGADKAVQYLASEMEAIGLTPGYDGSYLQQVPLAMMNLKPSKQMVFSTPSGELVLEDHKDFTAFTSSRKEEVTIDGSELIFAGYGIVAKEFGKNDYEGLTEAHDKVAVVFVNDPGLGSDTDYFSGDAMTYYGRWTYKFEEASRQGLKGVLIIHEDRGAGYGWDVVQASENVKYALNDPAVDTEGCPLQGWLSNSSARELLAKCGYDMDELMEKSKKPDFKPFPLNCSASVSIRSDITCKNSPNVVGYIPGSRHSGENIVCVAHWDHLGMIETEDGTDGIYNGATDNATAMAWLLETARAFKAMGAEPKRDIVFLCPTCEEKGMFGSEYYVTHPVSPIEKTVAVINLDVIPLWGENNDVTITGYGHSDLDKRVADIAVKYGRYVMADPEASNGMFYRSDHLPFMRRGVPAMFAKGWNDSREHGRQWSEEKIRDYWANTYHKVCDQTDSLNDDYSGLAQEVHLFIDLIHSLAFSNDWPQWYETSEFQREAE